MSLDLVSFCRVDRVSCRVGSDFGGDSSFDNFLCIDLTITVLDLSGLIPLESVTNDSVRGGGESQTIMTSTGSLLAAVCSI